MSKLLLLSIRLTQLLGICPLRLLTLVLNFSNSELVKPQLSGSVPDSLLLLRSRVMTWPGAKAAVKLGGKVPAVCNAARVALQSAAGWQGAHSIFSFLSTNRHWRVAQ